MILILALCSVKYSLVFGRIEVFDILPPPPLRQNAGERKITTSPLDAFKGALISDSQS